MGDFDTAVTMPEIATSPVGLEVLRGLTATPKTLSPWLFYDEKGSKLFEAITRLPEYYLTRTERSIFAEYGEEILECAGCTSDSALTMIELGAGTAAKTGLLLRVAAEKQGTIEYIPIDVSETALAEAKVNLESDIAGVRVAPRVGDYTEGIAEIRCGERRRMVLYIGSSIGNFEPDDAMDVLREVRRRLAPGDWLLLGADRVKDKQTLLRAYDDEAGITADFNKNVLARINRELGANFNPRLFRHRARWNEAKSRIEMHLESVTAQMVTVSALDLEVRFAAGETIHTENSYKFTGESIQRIVERAGFRIERNWTDEREWFGVYLAVSC